MAGLMHDDDRQLGGNRVQIMPGWMTTLGELRIVVVHADGNAMRLYDGRGLYKITHDLLQLRDGLAPAHQAAATNRRTQPELPTAPI